MKVCEAFAHARVFVPLCIVVGVAASPASSLAAMPPNDDFANAADLGGGLSASASGSNLWATAEAGEPRQVSGPALASVWYRWTASQNGVVAVQTCGSDFDTTLAAFRGFTLRTLGRVAANDDSCGRRSALRFFGVAGTTYYIAVDGRRGAQRSIELRLHTLTPPPNDDFINAIDLGTRLTAAASGANRDATVEPREPDHDGRAPIASVWYRWTARATRTIQIETCGSDFDTVLGVYVGPALDALLLVGSNDDACGTQSVLRFNAKAGTSYRIAVAGYRESQGSLRLKLAARKRRPAPESQRG
jgi:hypothetical protein